MGLIIMQNRGWIHWDIGARNILVYEQVRELSDLEFAIRYNPNADPNDSHMNLTGTKDFMSAELFAHEYLYWRPSEDIQQPGGFDEDVPPDDSVCDAPNSDSGGVFIAAQPPNQNFLQNLCHDAESLWWVALWTIARLYPVNRALNEDALRGRQDQYLKWFPDLPRPARNAFDIGLMTFVVDPLLSGVQAPQVDRPILSALNRWRTKVWYYIGLTQPRTKQFTPSGMDGLHQGVQDVIKTQNTLAQMRKIGDLELLHGFV